MSLLRLVAAASGVWDGAVGPGREDPLPGPRRCLGCGAYFGGNCWVAPGRGGSGSRAAFCWAARLAAVVSGSNWVLVGAGCGVPEPSAPVKLLKVARRQRLRPGKVTGPLPDRPPAPATVSIRRRQEVWSETSEKIRPPTDQGEMTKQGTRNPAPIGSPPPGVPAGEARVTNSSGNFFGSGVGGTTWSKNPSFSS